MIKKCFRLFNSIIINNIKMLLIKIFSFNKLKFKFKNIISPYNTIDIQGDGIIVLGKMINMPSKSLIGVREKGKLRVGNNTFINSNCQIVAHKRIEIGNDVCIGPNTVIMDHDHLYSNKGVDKKKFVSKDIIIEDGVWIGANCVILKGTKICKNSVIAAGSVVNFEVPENTILIQKRSNLIKKINSEKQD